MPAVNIFHAVCHHGACSARPNHEGRRTDRFVHRTNQKSIHGLRRHHPRPRSREAANFSTLRRRAIPKRDRPRPGSSASTPARDVINWQALLAKYFEERACSGCTERKPATAFTAGQWKRDDKDRVCRECTKHYADVGTPWQCNVCTLWHAEENFPEKHRQRQCSFFSVCA